MKIKFTRFGNLGSHPQNYKAKEEYSTPARKAYCKNFEIMIHKIKLEHIEYIKQWGPLAPGELNFILKSTLIKKNSPVGTDFLEVFIEKV